MDVQFLPINSKEFLRCFAMFYYIIFIIIVKTNFFIKIQLLNLLPLSLFLFIIVSSEKRLITRDVRYHVVAYLVCTKIIQFLC